MIEIFVSFEACLLCRSLTEMLTICKIEKVDSPSLHAMKEEVVGLKSSNYT